MASEEGLDKELGAIQTILTALSELDSQARTRVVDYIFRRLGYAASDSAISFADLSAATMPEPTDAAGTLPPPEQRDIRSLKEAKEPNSAVEMAAIVAYYLAELAPPSEHKEVITTANLEKYFKQARYPLPKALRVTLAQAASSGYFDSVARGQYKLNPVGYNLVAHGLPGKTRRRTSTPRAAKTARASKRTASPKKATSKKTAAKTR